MGMVQLQKGMRQWKVMDVFNPSPALPSKRKGEAVMALQIYLQEHNGQRPNDMASKSWDFDER